MRLGLAEVIDPRNVSSGQPFTGNLAPSVDVVDGPCRPLAAAKAHVFNATVAQRESS